MTAGELKIASLVFVALTITVAMNLLGFQDSRRAGLRDVAQKPRSSFEATVEAALQKPDLTGEAGAAAVRVAPPKSGIEPSANSAEITRGIQRELNQRGYEAGQPDGVAGLVTRAAIMAYEHDYGLPLTATASQELLSRIVLGSSAPQPQRADPKAVPGAEADAVLRTVKTQLAALGYTTGKADAGLDERTARAIREFEIDQKLAESGRVSGPMMSRLLALHNQSPATGSGAKTAPAAVSAVKAATSAKSAAAATASKSKPVSR